MTPAGRPDGHPRAAVPIRRRHPAAGFTLIELTVIVLIIGVLAGFAYSSYRGLVAKARMTQAKTALAHLAKTEAVYFSNNDRYTDNLALLDFEPTRYPYYQISVVVDNAAMAFTGYATGIGIMDGDLWFVTKDGTPTRDNTATLRN